MAPNAAFKTSAPSSIIASGSRSLKAIINRTPAANGVPYFTNLEESFSLPSKIKATDKESKPAEELANITTKKSDIFILSSNENHSQRSSLNENSSQRFIVKSLYLKINE